MYKGDSFGLQEAVRERYGAPSSDFKAGGRDTVGSPSLATERTKDAQNVADVQSDERPTEEVW